MNKIVAIEKNVPVTELRTGRPKRTKHAFWVELFNRMDENDSVLLSKKDSQTFYSTIRKEFGTDSFFRVLTRSQADGNIRVWKVKRDTEQTSDTESFLQIAGKK